MLKIIALTASLAVLASAFVEPQSECVDSDQGCPYDCSPASQDGLQYECWDYLNMTGYINEWVTENGTKAGVATKGFAQAFLSWSGYNGLTCNLITSETCTPPDTEDSKYQNYQQFYTLWNIYAVHQFYTQYSSALASGQSLAASKLGQIVDKVSPNVEHNTATPDWLTVITTSLYYATIAASPASAAVGPATGIIVPLLLNGLWAAKATPPVGEVDEGYTQTAQQRFQNLANIDADLANLVSDHQKYILAEVQAMQDNVESFIALCSPGGFSIRVTLSITEQSDALYKSLELFTLAEALTATGVVIAKSTGVDPRTVATDSGEISCPGFGPAGNCYDWWYDADNGNTYAFHDPNNEEKDFTDLINYIWDEGIVTDMADIFVTEDCSGVSPSWDSTSPKPKCVSNTKNCEYNYDTDAGAERKAQFTNCDNDPHWGYQCSSFSDIFILPESYLGPLLKKDNYCRHQ